MDGSGVGEREDKGEWCILWGHPEGERENPVTIPPPVPSWMLEVPSLPAADLRASPALHRASWATQSWVERVVLGSRLFLSQLSCPEGQRTPSQTVSKT